MRKYLRSVSSNYKSQTNVMIGRLARVLCKSLRKERFLDWVKFGVLLLAVLGVWRLGWWWIDNQLTFENLKPVEVIAARGQFGDKFGAVNALFAGFAFAGIIFTIYLQSKELSHTKRMLEEQMNDSKGQRFDGTFFQLIGLHNELTAKLETLNGTGRGAFKSINEWLMRADPDFPSFAALRKLGDEEVRALADFCVNVDGEDKEKKIRERLESFGAKLDTKDVSNLLTRLMGGRAVCDNYLDNRLDYQERKIRAAYVATASIYIDDFAHYFRNLYHLLRFLESSDLINEGERVRYARILRAQLSESELWAIFYNSITKVQLEGREGLELGYPKMGELLQKFDLIQHLSKQSLIHPTHLEIFVRNNGRAENVKSRP